VIVVGHAAADADRGLSQELAARRAQRVRLELMRFGIAGNRIAVESRGASDPIAPNDSTPSWRTSDRVALVLIHNDSSD
jgi:outer membrane protein OmpA-like peptidoglycan-associated protein